MRAAGPVLGCLVLAWLAACGGSSFEANPAPGASGAAGGVSGSGGVTSAGKAGATSAGSGGVTSAGSGGATSAGSGGATSAGSGGVTSAGSGGATSAGSGGATNAGSGGATSAGKAGATTAGSGGVTSAGKAGATSAGSGGVTSAGKAGATSAGSGGATSAGSGGGPPCSSGATECVGPSSVRTCDGGAWTSPVPCPAGPNACAPPTCHQGICKPTVVLPPEDPPNDCQKVVCSNGTVSAEVDPSDVPVPLGACDTPSCGSGAVHTPTDAKCSAEKRCGDGFKCVCRDCPDGVVSSYPTNECAFSKSTTATSSVMAADPSAAVDGSASTSWSPAKEDATLTLDVPPSLMAEVVLHPVVDLPAGSSGTTITWQINVVDANGASSPSNQTLKYLAGGAVSPVRFALPAPTVVEQVTISGHGLSGAWHVVEVTYVLCE